METTPDDGAAVFAGVRRRLFGIAYRMLGSWTEAADIVQDVWLRWQAYDRTTVQNAIAVSRPDIVADTVRSTVSA